MHTREKIKLGMLWGFSLTQQDMDKYCLYFALAETSYGCHFLEPYGQFFLVQTILWFILQPVSGWLSDYTEENQHKTLGVAAGIQGICFFLEFLRPIKYTWHYLLVIWSIRQVATIQSMNSVWKIVKLRMAKIQSERMVESNVTEDNVVVSRIGNVGDFCSDIFETSVMIFNFIMFTFLPSSYSYNALKWGIVGPAMVANVAVFVLAATITKEDIAVNPSNEVESLIQSYGAQEEEAEWNWHSPKSMMNFFWIRTKYFYHNKIAFHTCMHCFLLLIYYYLVEYPLTLQEAESETIDVKHLSNYCGGALSNLISQGTFLNITFLAGAVLYGIFLVRCPPLTYYLKVFPFLALVLGVATGSLLIADLPAHAVFAIVSVAQVLPYYISNYDFYVFTTSIDEKYYGWLSGLYGVVSQSISMLISYLLINPISNTYLIFACIIILAGSVVYSILFSLLNKRAFAIVTK